MDHDKEFDYSINNTLNTRRILKTYKVVNFNSNKDIKTTSIDAKNSCYLGIFWQSYYTTLSHFRLGRFPYQVSMRIEGQAFLRTKNPWHKQGIKDAYLSFQYIFFEVKYCQTFKSCNCMLFSNQ